MPTHASFAPARIPRPRTSPLLANTPPQLVRALLQSYQLLVIADIILGWITWSSREPYSSFLLVVGWYYLVNLWSFIVIYLWPAILVSVLVTSAVIFRRAEKQDSPSLETIVERLDSIGERWEALVSPVVSLHLTNRDITRLIATSVLSAPVYILASHLLLSAQTMVLWSGIIALTWHTLWFRVLRSILFRWKFVRTAIFILTGVSSPPSHKLSTNELESSLLSAEESKNGSSADAVRYTFVLYENQRRWLGIGWTSNLLGYERAPWTDEFLNEATAPESFALPDAAGTGLAWKWADASWRADLSCDGVLAPRAGLRYSVSPGEDVGFVYYDNVWSSPSPESGISKWVRRRRWIRMAMLCEASATQDASPGAVSNANTQENLKNAPDDESDTDQTLVDGEGSTAVAGPIGELKARVAR